ncbi:hypothetical protein EDD18DRAFT_1121539 [Armillaria luteobubalina]|uniref:C2H2-type domain-containing protein n=1 Tax=Armillaria luteobubalina TaxID=153913 RepID=A0AA39QQB0_9AGAR|nr:hypothetical protein IW262DRAFT_1329870 [Armillaria fumosa]KAK0505986.1 hypothetical protein EDD18DRAFT_1121539 [Armillaria luteobubalina]
MASAFTFDNFDYSKPSTQQGLDFLSFAAPLDVVAPHPDLFESELDSSLAGIDQAQLQLLTVDSNDAYSFLRSDTPTRGPPSAITESSARSSAYESSYDSAYEYPASNYSFPLDLEMDFQRIRVDALSDYSPANVDPNSFGSLPPTPPLSPPSAAAKQYVARTSYSDYGPPSRSAGYYYSMGQATVSPSHISTQLPVVPNVPPIRVDDHKQDPRKKYQCPSCPRAFARAYNLKTHMATHDPNRLKPHVCPHRSCGRSFSRKHDLGRHIISIHRDESVASSHHSNSSGKSIGVEQGNRSWCDVCGKGAVGRSAQCDCAEIK